MATAGTMSDEEISRAVFALVWRPQELRDRRLRARIAGALLDLRPLRARAAELEREAAAASAILELSIDRIAELERAPAARGGPAGGRGGGGAS